MTLAMTLLVRDEADVIDAHLKFHLEAGVDVVLATDHRSNDGTTEILAEYAKSGHVVHRREETARIKQSEWVTRMARLAASEFGATWVINSDADEFWWPRMGTLREALAAVPHRYGIVGAVSRPFVPLEGDEPFAERMTVRLTLAAPIDDPATPFRHVSKVAHRADPTVVVRQGNHDVRGPKFERLYTWHGIEILHFPLRSREQVERKHRTTIEAWEVNIRGDLARARERLDGARSRSPTLFDRYVLGVDAVDRGLRNGTLVRDTRLRDSLRRQGLESPTGASDGSRAIDAACFADAQAVRLQRWIDELGDRLGQANGSRTTMDGTP
jgi:hypothetical protein